MNHIGQALIPTLPVSPKPNPPSTPDKELPERGGSFDSFLQQCTEEPDEDVSKAEHATPDETQAQTAIPGENPDAAVQAGLIVMFAPPTVVPLPEPLTTTPPDATVSNPIDYGNSTALPDVTSASQQTPIGASEEASLSISELLPHSMPKLAAPNEDSNLPPAENTAQLLEVANILGIIPPVLPAATTTSESPLRSEKPVIALKSGPAFNQPPSAIGSEAAFFAEPGTAASANPAAQIGQPIPVEFVAPFSKSEESMPTPVKTPASEPANVISLVEKITGTTAAKPGSVMSAPTLQRQQRPSPATPAEVVSYAVAPEAAPTDGTQTLRPPPILTMQDAREHSANEHSENMDRSTTPTPEITSTTFTIEPLRTSAGNDVSTPIRAADVAQVMTHTLQATERMRVTGQERVELALKLDNGQELTIQLRVANGQVTPLIRTDSEPLRIALEQNWSRFSQNAGDRELRITTPVFESPQTSSNMSDPNHQRDERQRAFNEPAPEFSQQVVPRRNTAPPATRAPASIGTLSTGVRLYA